MSKILLVDDDGDMLMLTSRWLQRAGHEVKTAALGEQALDILSDEGADLVILDYAMPVMDGPAVLGAMRSDDALKDIPVIFRTGMEDAAAADIMDSLSPAAVVSKSEGKPALIAAVKAIL